MNYANYVRHMEKEDEDEEEEEEEVPFLAQKFRSIDHRRKSLKDSAISCMRPSTSVFWRLAKWRFSSTDRRTPIKKKFNKGLGGLFPWLTFCRAQRLVNGLVAGRERRDYRAVIRASRARKVFNSPRQEYNHEQGGFGTRCALYIYLHPTAANSTSI